MSATQDALFNLFYWWIPYYFYYTAMYFTAKKLGLIKTLDSIPLWAALIIVLIYEFFLVFSLPINQNQEPLNLYILHNYKLAFSNMLGYSRLGLGFIYAFFLYKTAKFLIKKYPKQFSWLLKLYPRKLEEIITFENFKKVVMFFITNLIINPLKWIVSHYKP